MLLISIFFTVSSCKEEEKDYRDGWIGDWDFIIETRIYIPKPDTLVHPEYDTVFYSGKIGLAGIDSMINIKYLSNDSIFLKIDENGTLSKFPNGYCRGRFEGYNKIYLYLRWGGVVGGISHTINGIKR